MKRYMIRRVNDGIEDELFSRIEKLGFTLKRKGNDYLDKYRLDSEWTSDFKIRNEEEMNKVGTEIDNIVDEYDDDIHNSITYNLAVDRNGVGHLNLDIRDKDSRHKNTRDTIGEYTDFSTHYLKRGGRNR